jgi:uncharacterized protein (DUF1800 family)
MAFLDAYAGPFTESEAAHLARRVAFGASPSEIAQLVGLGMSGAVDHYLDYPGSDPDYDDWVASFPDDTTDLGLVKNPASQNALIGQWLHRMIHGNYLAQEKLALFLHDTLVSEWTKVRSGITNRVNEGNDGSQPGQPCNTGTLPPDTARQSKIAARLLSQQVQLLRATGHGDYSVLIKAITRDPAMLLYLDNFLNTKTKPQENYGREVMELFTMGVGNYSENDVKTVSRAFTGETLNRLCQSDYPDSYFYDANQHDISSKTLFGSTYNLGAADTNHTIDLIFTRISNAVSISPAHAHKPATALYMAWNFITWYVDEAFPIDDPAVEELAEVFLSVSSNGHPYDVRETLRVLLKSQLFYDTSRHWKMVKNPVEYVVTAMRALGLSEDSYSSTQASSLRNMGMGPYSAPNVAGWDHGTAWINSGAVINRQNYANRLSGSSRFTDAKVDELISSGAVSAYGDNAQLIEYFRSRLLQEPLSATEMNLLTSFLTSIDGASSSLSKFRRKARGLVHIMMSMPLYQLK